MIFGLAFKIITLFTLYPPLHVNPNQFGFSELLNIPTAGRLDSTSLCFGVVGNYCSKNASAVRPILLHLTSFSL